MKLNTQEKKELDRYAKFLVLRAAQIIVQSRLGEKISTPSDPTKIGTDWFNLNIPENAEVTERTKKALNGEILRSPVCIQIALKDQEIDKLPLEYWCFTMLPEKCDPSSRMMSTVYNQMSILLKSLISVTRVTPAYQLSQRQSHDSYIIMYEVTRGMPPEENLGKDNKYVKVGQICTPIGTIQLSVSYRIDMTDPKLAARNNYVMVKSDHFNANLNNRKEKNDDNLNDLTTPMRPGPFADPLPKMAANPQLPDVTRLLSLAKQPRRSSVTKSELESESYSREDSGDEQKENRSGNSPPKSANSSLKIAKSPPKIPSSPPKITNSPGKAESIPPKDDSTPPKDISTMSSSIRSTTSTTKSTMNDEYWMQELSAPFATPGPIGELMQFYRQCRRSPPLPSPPKNLTPEEINEIINKFEMQLPEYDAVVKSLCESPDN